MTFYRNFELQLMYVIPNFCLDLLDSKPNSWTSTQSDPSLTILYSQGGFTTPNQNLALNKIQYNLDNNVTLIEVVFTYILGRGFGLSDFLDHPSLFIKKFNLMLKKFDEAENNLYSSLSKKGIIKSFYALYCFDFDSPNQDVFIVNPKKLAEYLDKHNYRIEKSKSTYEFEYITHF